MPYTIPLNKIRNSDVALVGGKNAFLGEMYRELPQKGGEGPKLDKKEFVKLKSLIILE